jgi:hypothetical protein
MGNSLNRGFSAIVAVVVVAVLLVGIGAAVMMRDSSPSSSSSERGRGPVATDSEETVGGEIESTLPDIISRGQSLECDWRMPIEEADNPFGTGKLYTTGNKGRSMITGNLGGGDFEGNAIYMNNEVYTWMNIGGNTIGFKFDESELSEADSEMTPEERVQAEQIAQDRIFNCSPWTPDESLFVLPEGVSFE